MKNRSIDITDYLNDIIQYAEDAIGFTSNSHFTDFSNDKKTIYAVVRCIEIIGEAAKKLPPHFRREHEHIPWIDIIGMRNKLIHDYAGIDLIMVWKTATEDLPQLLEEIKKLR